MKRIIILIILLPIILIGNRYYLTEYIPKGVRCLGRDGGPHISDFDRDGEEELILWVYYYNDTLDKYDEYIWFYEHTEGDSFIEAKEIYGYGYPMGVGDFDNDGLYELITYSGNTNEMYTMEQLLSNEYPDTINWSDSAKPLKYRGVSTMLKSDSIDRIYGLGIPWLSDEVSGYGWFYYESTGDNNYEITHTYAEGTRVGNAMDVGDIDNDGLCDVVVATTSVDSSIIIYEAVDSLQDSFVAKGKSSGKESVYSLIITPDIDKDGKKEILSYSTIVVNPSYTKYLFALEEYNDSGGIISLDTIWKVKDSIPVLSGYWLTYGGDIAYGDVTGDGKEDIIVCGGRRVQVWESVGDNSFEKVWEWLSEKEDLLQSHVRAYDFNNNGVDEIIYSGYGTSMSTYIYEDSSVVLQIDSAIGYEGDSIKEMGIDEDDYIVLYFSNRSNGYEINKSNIDSVLRINNNHSWLYNDSIGDIKWEQDSTRIRIGLIGADSSIINIGDSIVPVGSYIRIYDNKTGVKGAVRLRGSFDYVGVEKEKEGISNIYRIKNNRIIVDSEEELEINIYDIIGRKQTKQKINRGIIELNEYSNGIYFIRIKTKTKEYKEKIIVIK